MCADVATNGWCMVLPPLQAVLATSEARVGQLNNLLLDAEDRYQVTLGYTCSAQSHNRF